MFNDYDTARALVAQHQQQLRREAVLRRALRSTRRPHPWARRQDPTA